MIDAEMIKARLGRLLAKAGTTGPARPSPADGHHEPAIPGFSTAILEVGGIGPIPDLDPSPSEIAELLATRGVEAFVERSYLRILGRAPDLKGGLRHARLLKTSPLHSRRRFLAKLLRSEERLRFCRAELEARTRRLDDDRRAVLDRAREVEELRETLRERLKEAGTHRRLLDEQTRLLEEQGRVAERLVRSSADQKALLDAQKPIPGLHVRLLEQYRQRFEAIGAIVDLRNDELEAQRVVFEVQAEEFGRNLADFARQREDLAAQREELARIAMELEARRDRVDRQLAHQATLSDHQSKYLEQLQLVLEVQRRGPDHQAGLIEQIRVLPQLQADLLGEQRRLFERQEREGDRRIEQAEAIVRGLVEAWEVADTLPISAAARGSEKSDPYLAEVEIFVHESYRLILRRAPEPAELAEASGLLRSAVGKLKGDFLNALLARQSADLGNDLTPAIESGRPAGPHRCRICEGDLVYKWSRKVLHNRHVAHYHECEACRALQVVDPTWLAEAYSDEATPQAENPDQGRFARNFTAYHCVAAMVESGMLPPRPMVLDFGGGYGILTQMFRSAGYEAWQADPHVPVPFLAADRGLSRLEDFPDGSFELVTALEVMEHLDDPQPVIDRLARLLKPGGTLLVSTTVYHPGEHDQNWFYLSAEWGQHITFWSRSALAQAARAAGFRSLGFFPGGEGFFILFSGLPAEALSAKLGEALEMLRDGRLLTKITAPWDLQNMGFVRALDHPDVIALDPSGRQQDAFPGRGAA